jgi:TonB family protein
MMTPFIDSTIKVAVIVLVALASTFLLRRSAAAVRHWALAVAIACAVATPALTLIVPSWTVSLKTMTPLGTPAAGTSSVTTTIMAQNPDRQGESAAAAPAGAVVRPSITLTRLLVGIWLAGMFLSLSLVVVGLTRLRRVAAAARPLAGGPWVQLTDEIARAAGLRTPVALLQSDHPTLLVTWGWRRPKIILPAIARGWAGQRARIVLCHELAHIRRGDWAAQMLGELLRAIYWFNPLVWTACRRLRQESEHACDDAVLQSGVDPTDYATHLLDLARTLNTGRRLRVPAPAMARASSLEGRISAMLNTRLDRGPLTPRTRIAIAAALLIATVSMAGAAAQARFSTLSGTVVDETNGFLPGTTLVLINAAIKARHEVQSDRTGHFEFVGLPPGDYTLQVIQAGFTPFSEAITVAGRDISRAIQLQVGSLQETIRIVAPDKSQAAAAQPISDEERAQKTQAIRQKAQYRQQSATEKCATATTGGMGGNILQPWKLVDVKPVYPEHLTSARIGGTVTMEALIGTDGIVRDVRIVSSPHPDLDRAAADAVRQWEFTPTILNCTPIEVRMNVTATFEARP